MPNAATRDADVLIVGQGLAGSTLAWRLAERGVSALVVDRGGIDRDGRPAASRVAGGLITPVTGKRLTVAPTFPEQWRTAKDFYRSVEEATGARLLDEQPAVRVFVSREEREAFERRSSDDEFRRHSRLAEAGEAPAGLAAPWGAFVMPGAARLRTGAYLDATRRWLEAGDRFVLSEIDAQRDLCITHDAVTSTRLGVTAKVVIFCQGYERHPPAWTDGMRLAAAKGEVLTIEASELGVDRVTHCGVWMAPCESGAAGRLRVGATNAWDRLNSVPTAAARDELLRRLAEAGVERVEVVDHQAAVRPATADRVPLAGWSAREPRAGWLNGFGAKGALWAPTYAERMAEILVDRLRVADRK